MTRHCHSCWIVNLLWLNILLHLTKLGQHTLPNSYDYLPSSTAQETKILAGARSCTVDCSTHDEQMHCKVPRSHRGWCKKPSISAYFSFLQQAAVYYSYKNLTIIAHRDCLLFCAIEILLLTYLQLLRYGRGSIALCLQQ